jgi:hypothetical protein
MPIGAIGMLVNDHPGAITYGTGDYPLYIRHLHYCELFSYRDVPEIPNVGIHHLSWPYATLSGEIIKFRQGGVFFRDLRDVGMDTPRYGYIHQKLSVFIYI